MDEEYQAVVVGCDDQYVEGVRTVLENVEVRQIAPEDVEAVLGEARDADVVVLGPEAMDSEPAAAVERLTAEDGPDVVAVADAETDPESVVDALAAGATSYVDRSVPDGSPATLADHVRRTTDGASAKREPPSDQTGTFGRELRARRRAQRQRRALLESAPEPTVMTDGDGTLVDCNAGFAALVGTERELLVGRQLADLGPELAGTDAGDTTSAGERTIEVDDRERVVVVETADDEGSGEVLRDVTAQRRREQELEEQTKNLEILNQVTRHDIRNDMQVILGMVDVLGGYVDEEGREYLDKLEASSQHVVDLTRQARDLTETMLNGDEELSVVSLRPVLEAQIDEVGSAYDGAVVTVSDTIPGVSVVADELLSSVFRNIIANGIQHNDAEVPRVTVSATARDDEVEVRIADNGPGIPDERKREIFGRGEKGLESSGTGLGLYLVDTLVTKYGGEVRVTDGPDGAEFVVVLPLAGSD